MMVSNWKQGQKFEYLVTVVKDNWECNKDLKPIPKIRQNVQNQTNSVINKVKSLSSSMSINAAK